MSGKRRSNSRAWLKAVGFAAIIAAHSGGLLWSVWGLLWLGDVCSREYRSLIVPCVSVLVFFVLLPVFSREIRVWWRRLPRARRVSVWLFWGTMALFAVSQASLSMSTGRVQAWLGEGAVMFRLWEEPSGLPGVELEGFEGFRIRCMPAAGFLPLKEGDRAVAMVPLWVIGALALWPWWKPGLVWLLGGRVRRGRPLRSTHYRVACLAFLVCCFAAWLSHQRLFAGVEAWCVVEMDQGWLLCSRGAGFFLATTFPRWGMLSYEGLNDVQWFSVPGGSGRWDVVIPLWPAPVVGLAWLILAGRPRHRFRRRWENGLCLHCGYDLRGLKERCTECGQPIEPERLAQVAGDGGQPGRDAPGGVIEAESPRGEEKP